jgi:copper resistance protein B
MRSIVVLALACAATPAIAQDHSGHAMPAPPAAEQTDCEAEAARHRAMGHAMPGMTCAPEKAPSAEPSGMDHAQMDHATMDHGAMDHGATQGMDHSPMNHGSMATAPIPEGPPPAAAASGPPRAADAIWGADAMRASRAALRREQGGMSYLWLQGDRAEYRARAGGDGYLWDVQGYYGGDIDKAWFKSEGEGSLGDKPESAEIQGLWSHAIGPWWDFQAGIRQDLTGPERTHAVIGVQGLSPYRFEVDAAAFLSTKGDLTARIEAEIDQRITQRLILQPRAEANLSAQDVPELGTGAGLDTVELGMRLRYEFAREFAPYIGIEQEWKLGKSADYARLAGEDPSVTNYVVGLRFWF